jgi:hypothetical protein
LHLLHFFDMFVRNLLVYSRFGEVLGKIDASFLTFIIRFK